MQLTVILADADAEADPAACCRKVRVFLIIFKDELV
jgi:hypothetical protein